MAGTKGSGEASKDAGGADHAGSHAAGGTRGESGGGKRGERKRDGEQENGGSGRKRGIRRLFSLLGPGLVTGTADDDPAGITTYSQAGAQYQYGLLWTALLQIPLMIGVQLMSARIGLVTGRNLIQVVRERTPAWVAWTTVVLLVLVNLLTAAADLAGVAAGLQLLTRGPRALFVPVVALLLLVLLVFAHYGAIQSVLKWLTLALFGYIVAGVLSGADWGEVLKRTFVPGIRPSREYLSLFVSIFGTTISPYMFLWQSAEEVEEQRKDDARGRQAPSRGRRPQATAEQGGTERKADRGGKPGEAKGGSGRRPRRVSARKLRDVRFDTVAGMAVSQVIGFFIIMTAGATLYPMGEREIGTAREAARALQPIGGGMGTVLFSIGMIGTGLLAVCTLVGGIGYAAAALGRRRADMSAQPTQARFFYGVIAVAMLLSAGVATAGVSPVALLLGSALVNGLLAPPLLAIMLWICNDEKIMGEQTNGPVLNTLAGLTLLIMGATSIALLAWWLKDKL